MGIDHIQMALVDRDIDRLADRAAGMMEPRDLVGELHEILEILDIGVAPPALEIAHERGAIGWREDDIIAANFDIPGGVAGMLGELSEGAFPDDGAQHTGLKPHPFAVHIGARLLPDFDHFRVIAKFDTDILEDRVGGGLDRHKTVFAQQLVGRDIAHKTCNNPPRVRLPLLLTGLSPAAPATPAGALKGP